jgi:hypothetical protein
MKYLGSHSPPTVAQLSRELSQVSSALDASSSASRTQVTKYGLVEVSQKLRLPSNARPAAIAGRLSLAGWFPADPSDNREFCKGDLLLHVYGEWTADPLIAIQLGMPATCTGTL